MAEAQKSDAKKSYLKGSHTAERVAAEIRRAIRHRELLPGEHVVQDFWAQKVGVSSAPTREALKMLVVEQLLVYDAHRGYFVARIDPAEMEQIYVIRQLLESEVFRRISWPSDDEIDAIRKLIDEALRLIKQGDSHGALDAYRTFSFTLFNYAPDKLLVRETERFWDMAVVYRALSMDLVNADDAKDATSYHKRLFEYLEAGDRDGLIELNKKRRAAVPRNVYDF
jgi:DNA-binding GntR family transcriptional regulator